jgi:hypothetical protein
MEVLGTWMLLCGTAWDYFARDSFCRRLLDFFCKGWLLEGLQPMAFLVAFCFDPANLCFLPHDCCGVVAIRYIIVWWGQEWLWCHAKDGW